MKVEYTYGCIADTLEIDGSPFGDTHNNSLNGITENLLRYIRKQCKEDREYLQELLIATTERFGETELLHTCEQCGDSVFKTTVDMTLKRKPYKKGLKEYLASFSVGEKREYDKVYAWRSIIGIASVMKKDFGCVFKVNWKDKSITRLVMRWNYEVRWYEFNLTEQCSRKFVTEIGAKLYKLYLEHFEGAVAKIYEI